MTLRILNNKRIEMTDDEFTIYQGIVESYSKDNFDGKQLFDNLFETDNDGLIVCLKPPTKTFSFEVVAFIQNIMVHQHLRKIYKDFSAEIKEVRELKRELQELIDNVKKSSDDVVKDSK